MKFGFIRTKYKPYRNYTEYDSYKKQREALLNVGCEEIYEDCLEPRATNRPQLLALLDRVKEGDTVVVYNIYCIARKLNYFKKICSILKEKKVHFISLDWLDRLNTEVIGWSKIESYLRFNEDYASGYYHPRFDRKDWMRESNYAKYERDYFIKRGFKSF